MARESDDVFYTWAGPEIAVASTKAYTTQLICMYLIGLYMGSTKGTIEKDYYTQVLEELKLLPEKVEKLFGEEDQIAALARKYHRKDQVFYVGRGLPNSGVSYEGSLKLKENLLHQLFCHRGRRTQTWHHCSDGGGNPCLCTGNTGFPVRKNGLKCGRDQGERSARRCDRQRRKDGNRAGGR